MVPERLAYSEHPGEIGSARAIHGLGTIRGAGDLVEVAAYHPETGDDSLEGEQFFLGDRRERSQVCPRQHRHIGRRSHTARRSPLAEQHPVVRPQPDREASPARRGFVSSDRRRGVRWTAGLEHQLDDMFEQSGLGQVLLLGERAQSRFRIRRDSRSDELIGVHGRIV